MESRVLNAVTCRVTQGYSATHRGVDLVKAPSQTCAVTAHGGGVVVACQTGKGRNVAAVGTASYGNYVKIDHQNGYQTLYAHLANTPLRVGDRVCAGQQIGYMGNTGRSFGAHLHFEVRCGDTRIDPTPFLNAELPPFIAYRGYTDRWLAEVRGCHDGSDGFAGIRAKPLSALAVQAAVSVRYRVHLKDRARWLPWVTAYNLSDPRDGYAGNTGEVIDAVQIQTTDTQYEVQYRTSSVGGGWHGWCVGLTDVTGDGYAGVFGKAVDRVQMRLIRKEGAK